MGLYRATLSGQILDANPALLQLLGFHSRESLMAVNLRDIHTDPRSRRSFLERLEREGEVHDLELQWKRYGGPDHHGPQGRPARPRPFGKAPPLRGRRRGHHREQARAPGAPGIQPVSRKRSSHGAGEGIVVYDRDLRYIVWNRYMERMTGLPAERSGPQAAGDASLSSGTTGSKSSWSARSPARPHPPSDILVLHPRDATGRLGRRDLRPAPRLGRPDRRRDRSRP